MKPSNSPNNFLTVIKQLRKSKNLFVDSKIAEAHLINNAPWTYRNQILQNKGEYANDVRFINFWVNDMSKSLYRQGKERQGYIGVANLLTGEVHLFPCFNLPCIYDKIVRKFGLEKATPSSANARKELAYQLYFSKKKNICNRNGTLFNYEGRTDNCTITVPDPHGTNTGLAHEQGIQYAGYTTNDRDLLVGFGIFKGDNSFIINDFRDRSANLNASTFIRNPNLSKLYKNNPNPRASAKQHKRAMPQAISTKLLYALLDQLPLPNSNAARDLNIDGRVMSFYNPLHVAIKEGDVEKVKFCVDNHYDVNEYALHEEVKPMSLALIANDLNIYKFLLDHEDFIINLKTIKCIVAKLSTENLACLYFSSSNFRDYLKMLLSTRSKVSHAELNRLLDLTNILGDQVLMYDEFLYGVRRFEADSLGIFQTYYQPGHDKHDTLINKVFPRIFNEVIDLEDLTRPVRFTASSCKKVASDISKSILFIKKCIKGDPVNPIIDSFCQPKFRR